MTHTSIWTMHLDHMAITASNLRDASARFKVLVIFTLFGLVLGVVVGWAVEADRVDPQEREHAAAYAAGWAMQSVGLAGQPNAHATKFLTVYRTIESKFPDSGAAIESAATRVALFPWPVVGVFMGWGLLLIYSRFLAYSKSKTE